MQPAHTGDRLRRLRAALLHIVAERALFPLLVSIDRFGPIGVVALADRIGRDDITVSR